MNRLKGLSAYLSGPIDFEKDLGHGWRNMITPFLESMGVKVLNPLSPPFSGADKIPEKRIRMDNMLKNNQFEELHKEMKELVHMDLRSVDLSSFIVCNYDSTIHMCGTYEEIFQASKSKIPVLLVHKKSRNELSSWMYGRFNPQYFYASWDKLKMYLTDINSNPSYNFTEADEKRWLFFDGPHMR